MSGSTTLLPFQPLSMSAAHLAAVSYLARYAGRTHDLYPGTYADRARFENGTHPGKMTSTSISTFWFGA